MIKVVFLDIDGVLNDHGRLMESFFAGGSNNVICVDMVARLNKIIDATGAVCVLCSTWRLVYGTQKTVDLMKKRGFTGEVIGETPDCCPKTQSLWASQGITRGYECNTWMFENKHLNIESYLILDDAEKFPGMEHRRIKTVYAAPAGEGGLQDKHIRPAIEILNKPLWKD